MVKVEMFEKYFNEENDGVVLTSQAGSLLGDMISWRHIISKRYNHKWISWLLASQQQITMGEFSSL